MDSNKPTKIFFQDSNKDGVFDGINCGIAIMAIILILLGAGTKIYAASKNNDKLSDAGYTVMLLGGGILIPSKGNSKES